MEARWSSHTCSSFFQLHEVKREPGFEATIGRSMSPLCSYPRNISPCTDVTDLVKFSKVT